MDKPLVSILIPSFYEPRFLNDCLYSCAKQDYSNLEIIVRDNYSKYQEEFKSLIEIYNQYFKIPIKYIRNKENVGYLKNSHDGIAINCSGKYSILLNQDDFLVDSTFISSSVEIMEKNKNVKVVFGLCGEFIDQENSIEVVKETTNKAKSVKAKIRLINGNYFFKNFWTKFNPLPPSGIIFNRKEALKLGWNQMGCEDQSLLLLLSPGYVVGAIEIEVAKYRIHSQSMMNKLTPEICAISHEAVFKWISNAKIYGNFSSIALIAWQIKTTLIKEKGLIERLQAQDAKVVQRYLLELKRINYLSFFLIKHFSYCLNSEIIKKKKLSINSFMALIKIIIYKITIFLLKFL